MWYLLNIISFKNELEAHLNIENMNVEWGIIPSITTAHKVPEILSFLKITCLLALLSWEVKKMW